MKTLYVESVCRSWSQIKIDNINTLNFSPEFGTKYMRVYETKEDFDKHCPNATPIVVHCDEQKLI